MLAASGGYSSRQGRRSVSPRSPARCAAADSVSTHRYARALAITASAFSAFRLFRPRRPRLRSWRRGRGEKPARPRPGSLRPPLWPRPAGTPGQASAGGPFSRLPPSHFLVSVAVGSSGATPPPPPRRPVSPAAIKAEWGGLGRGGQRAAPGPLGAVRGAPAPPPILGPRGGAFFSFAAAGIDIVAVATPGHYMLRLSNSFSFIVSFLSDFQFTRTVYAGKRKKLYEKRQRKRKIGRAIFLNSVSPV